MKLYLHQFLSRTGRFSSKRELVERIRNGEIAVAGSVITNPMHSFDPGRKRVYWKGDLLKLIKKKIYIVVNKPEGCLSSRLAAKDRELRKKSVFGLISAAQMDEALGKTLFCVGRLDEDSSGLLLITNDGRLGHRITEPNSNIEKTYDAVLGQPVTDDEVAELEKGVVIELEENGKKAFYKTEGCKIRSSSDRRHLRITLTEGRKREVRRMFEKTGNAVLQLQRTAIGRLNLADLGLGKGEYVFVDKELVDRLVLSA